jgi:phosphoribosylglycinamide formyltransferase 1
VSAQARLVVLASGRGSNFQALLDAARGQMPKGLVPGRLDAKIAALVSDRPGAPVLERARAAGIPALLLPPKKGKTRAEYGTRLAAEVAAYAPDFVILLGWMRLLSSSFLGRFPGKVVNLHPALPGAFPGTEAIAKAYAAFREGKVDKTGVMIHFVPDEGVDSGPLIASEEVEIRPEDSLEDLEARIHETEHRLLVATLSRLIQSEQTGHTEA